MRTDANTNAFKLERVETPERGAVFQHLAARSHHELLHDLIHRKEVVVVGVLLDDEPVGLTIALIESADVTDVISVFVSKVHRRCGLARQMVTAVEEIAREHRCIRLLLGVRKDSQFEPIKNVVLSCGWEKEPRGLTRLLSVCGPTMRLHTAPWLKKRISNRRLEVVPWHEVDSDEIERIRSAAETEDCWYPQSLSPITDNRNLHRPTSIGLVFDGRVIGWSLTHQALHSPVVFSIMFARKTPELPMAGLALLQATADRLIALGQQRPTMLSCAILDGNKFLEFMARKVFPYLDTETQEMWVFRKELDKPLS